MQQLNKLGKQQSKLLCGIKSKLEELFLGLSFKYLFKSFPQFTTIFTNHLLNLKSQLKIRSGGIQI